MRSFIAVDMPDKIRDILEDLQSELPAGNPAPPDNLHLTLAFLGEQRVEMLEDLRAALERFSAPAFDLQLSGVDTFGGNDPKVVFAGVLPNPALEHLHGKLKSALHGAGLMLDRKRFRPHVTIARFGQRPRATAMERLRRWLIANADFRTDPFAVKKIVLYRSTLSRSGAIHDELAHYPLS